MSRIFKKEPSRLATVLARGGLALATGEFRKVLRDHTSVHNPTDDAAVAGAMMGELGVRPAAQLIDCAIAGTNRLVSVVAAVHLTDQVVDLECIKCKQKYRMPSYN